MKKRVVSWLLVVLMLTSLLPTGAWAADVYQDGEDTQVSEQRARDGSGIALLADVPVEISTAADFKNMAATGSYVLKNDITLTAAYAKTFKGTFDGGGYTVTLTASASSGNLGLFNETGKGALIENVLVKAENASSKGAGMSYGTGGLVGVVNGDTTIRNCGVTGTITNASTNSNPVYMGGLVGYHRSGALTISECFANVDVQTTKNTSGASALGGLIGKTSSGTGTPVTVTNCYAVGKVTANKGLAGGLVGADSSAAKYPHSYENCYAAGMATSGTKDKFAGFINIATGSTYEFTNCYYNSENPQSALTGITGKSSAELKELAGMLGTAYAADDRGINGGYPVLSWQGSSSGGGDTPATTGTVTITVVPKNAVLTWNDTEQPVSDSGSYTFSELAPGNYDYTVTPAAGTDYQSASGTVTVKEGDTRNLTVTLLRNEHRLTFERQGEAAGWALTVKDKSTGAAVSADADGSYPVLGGGTYTYTVETPWGYEAITGSVTIGAGDETVPITPQKLAAWTVTFDCAAGGVVEVTYQKYYKVTANADGSYTLPLGRDYTWTVTYPNGGYIRQTGVIALTNEAAEKAETITVPAVAAPEGTGTAEDPYRIGNAAQLVWFAGEVNGDPTVCAVLTDDIDLSGSAWTPMGPYAGTFDGAGHTIRNMTVTGDKAGNYGLFAQLNGGVIRGLTVSGTVTVTDSNNNCGAGGIVGRMTGGTVERCAGDVTVNGKFNVGGIVGLMGSGTVSQCVGRGSVSGTYNAGGIAGQINGAGSVTNCYTRGSVSAWGQGGGIVGNLNHASASVADCYTIGSVTNLNTSGSGDFGAVTGKANSHTTESCYYLTGEGVPADKSGAQGLTGGALKLSILRLGDAFRGDSTGINGGYPVLAWQAPQQTASEPVYAQNVEFAQEQVQLTSSSAAAVEESYGLLASSRLTWDAVQDAEGYVITLWRQSVGGESGLELVIEKAAEQPVGAVTEYDCKDVLAGLDEGVYYATVTAMVNGAYAAPAAEYADTYVVGYQNPYDRMKAVANVRWEGTKLCWDGKTYQGWDDEAKAWQTRPVSMYSVNLYLVENGSYKLFQTFELDGSVTMIELADVFAVGKCYAAEVIAHSDLDMLVACGLTDSVPSAMSGVYDGTGSAPVTPDDDHDDTWVAITSARQWIELANVEDVPSDGSGSDSLQKIAWGKKYYLANDLDFSQLSAADQAKTKSIGNVNNRFMGTLDGNGYTIRGLTLSNSDSGLFWYVGATGYIYDLTVEGANVQFSDNAAVLAHNNYGTVEKCAVVNTNITADTGAVLGGMVSRNYGIIRDSYVAGGSLTSNSTTSTGHAGFVGANEAGGLIERCWTSMSVSTRSDYAGGFVGLGYGGTIRDCYALGNVSARSYSGGFAGRFVYSGNVTESCYAAGIVTVTGAEGNGFTGGNKPDSNFQYDQAEGVRRCWYNGANASAAAYGAVSLTAEEMRGAAFLTELNDGRDVWTQSAEQNGGMPYLKTAAPAQLPAPRTITVQVAVVTYDKEAYAFDFDGRRVVPVTMESSGNTRVADLMDAAQQQGLLTYAYAATPTYGRFIHTINGHAVEAPDGWMFTINDTLSNVSASLATVKDGDRLLWFEGTTENLFQGPLWAELDGSTVEWVTISTAEELKALAETDDPAVLAKNYRLAQDIDLAGVAFRGIGSASVPFTGSFDGQGHTISNAAVSGGDCTGFFNAIKGASIKNLHLTGVNVSGGSRVGGLVGLAQAELDGENMSDNKANLIGGCTVSGTVSGQSAVGGLVGCNEGKFDKDTLFSVASAVDKCTAAAAVTGQEKTGGLVGENGGTVTRSTAAGAVNGKNTTGGLVGYNSGDVYDSSAAGAVRGTDFTGGFVGYSYDDALVKNCYCTGNVTGTDYTGGFAGSISRVENAVSAGRVSIEGNSVYGYNGGFAGQLGGTLSGLANQITVKNVYGNCAKAGGTWNPVGNMAAFTEQSDVRAVRAMSLTVYKELNAKLVEMFGVSLPGYRDAETLMDAIAATLTGTKDGWSAMDMAAYQKLDGKSASLTDAARQNIVDLLIAEAAGTADASARSRIELVLRALGTDTTKLYPAGSSTAVNNAALLQGTDMSTVMYWTAPYVLLANMQGGVKLTAQQIETLIAALAAAESGGVLGSTYAGVYYADADTTGAAIAALSAYADSHSSARALRDKLVSGAAAHVADAGYFSNANSDAMLIIGFAAAGVDPDEVFCASGISLTEDLLRYVNSTGNGFLYGGEENALATEQGFRALIALAQLRKDGAAYNFYDFSGTAVKPGHASGTGEPETPPAPPEDGGDITVTVSVSTPSGMWLDGKRVTVKKGATVYHAFVEALEGSGITQSGAASGYVRSMSKGGKTYGEFTEGPNSGWLYKVNGVLPSVPLTQKTLADGDDILWYYTADWKQDPAAAAMAAQDEITAEDVIKLIDAIGDVTLDSGSAIAAARAAYNRLSDQQKALVTNYAKLTAAEAAYAALVQAQQKKDGGKTNDVWRQQYEKTLDAVADGQLTFGSEWRVIALARSGRTVPDSYYDSVVKAVQDAGGVLSEKKYTEYSRVILALTAIGKDPTDVGGYDLLARLADMDAVTYQGLNGAIFALIALDSGRYEIPAAPEGVSQTSREALVACILEQQLADGGWALSGSSADPDMTAMAVQALAAYRGEDDAVQAAVDKAVQTLSDMQLADGGYSSWGTANSESCAQVIIALTALGIDPATDSRFVKYGCSLLDALSAFYTDGGFRHVSGGSADGIATEQALCALTAYARLLNGETALYDMAEAAETDTVTPETPDADETPQPAGRSGAVVWVIVAAAAVAAGAAVVAAGNRRKKQ